MSVRIIVIGASGQLGKQVARLAAGAAHDVLGWSSRDVDVTDEHAVAAAIEAARPSVVINCAAYTAVDAAESDYRAAAAVNVSGAGNIAAACTRSRAHLIHVSTDYVFPGDAREPYEPGSRVGPRTVYGQTKYAGELAVHAVLPSAHIVRTSWVFTGTGSDFVATMLRLERERDTLRVVDDQWGSPTYSVDLAAGLVELATSRRAGPLSTQQATSTAQEGTILHATNSGITTWWGLAREVFAAAGADPERVQPCSTAEFPRPAPRPASSVLGGESWRAAALRPLRPWRDAVREAVRVAVADPQRMIVSESP
ncbi:dTDP-4-dehydrorhamnose reductase [Hoyosella sp. G463]|uniref:dTDP-4-dehydrorhamnose reductase n=1 Tax=Lolliginicoccus lacisalsi TaxID=2742202 RepID=A0A927JCM7_9ACTN|nr:dTDP-4-dehydrorhamnose reductase [Lolliginicoccus lacisalsi]MBD8506596.1 dTDP-4-dehydrorhamnose reductase [Lolliginicoccus lacisalsi]